MAPENGPLVNRPRPVVGGASCERRCNAGWRHATNVLHKHSISTFIPFSKNIALASAPGFSGVTAALAQPGRKPSDNNRTPLDGSEWSTKTLHPDGDALSRADIDNHYVVLGGIHQFREGIGHA